MLKRQGVIFTLGLLISIWIFQGCVTSEPPKLMVPLGPPMKNTMIQGYVQVEEIYQSDKAIQTIILWNKMEKPEKAGVKLLIKNQKAETVYTWEKTLSIDSWVYYYPSIPLDEDLKNKLSGGDFTIYLYVNDQQVDFKKLKYVPADSHNPNIAQIVVLPVVSYTAEVGSSGSIKDPILDTLAVNLYLACEKIATNAVHPYEAVEKIGDINLLKCFDEPVCVDKLKDLFGEAVIIAGAVRMPKYAEDFVHFRVYAYDTKTGQKKEFKHFYIAGLGRYSDDINQILKEILYKKGLVDYLKGL